MHILKKLVLLLFFCVPLIAHAINTDANTYVCPKSHCQINFLNSKNATRDNQVTAYWVAAGSNGNIYVAPTIGAPEGVFTSSDRGKIWEHYRFQGGEITTFYFSNGVIYFGTKNGLFISKNSGQSWKKMMIAGGSAENNINSVFVRNKTIYVATSVGLSISDDAGKQWSHYSKKDFLGPIYATKKAIYVGVTHGLAISNDHGKTWHNIKIGKGKPSDQVNALQVSAGKIDLGRDKGLYISSNGGETWVHYSLRYSMINSVYVSGKTIYVAADSDLLISYDLGKIWYDYAPQRDYVRRFGLIPKGNVLWFNNMSVSGNKIYLGNTDGLLTLTAKNEKSFLPWDNSAIPQIYAGKTLLSSQKIIHESENKRLRHHIRDFITIFLCVVVFPPLLFFVIWFFVTIFRSKN